MTAPLPRRPRLLFLCHTFPYPPDGGPWIRTYHVLRLLAEAFDITALCFERAGARSQGAGAVSGGIPPRLAQVEVFSIPQRHSRLRFVWDHLRSTVSGRVYTKYLYDSTPFRRRLEELLSSERFDLVHMDSLDLADYLPACTELPVVCVHHDIESVLLARRARVHTNVVHRAYLRYQAQLMRRVERRWCERLALNVVCSEHDARVLQDIAPASRVTVVPNGVDTGEFVHAPEAGRGVAFVGGTSPFPNGDALDFFCERILPWMQAEGCGGPARWIGRASAGQRERYRARYGVELTGYVDDVRPYMRDAACHIVPLRVGGGTRLKILNSWAMGKAVVSTSLGCEGLAALDGENILIRDDPREFARAILAVLRDEALGRRLGENGRATVERLYGWDTIGARMIEAYLDIAERRSQGAVRGAAGMRPPLKRLFATIALLAVFACQETRVTGPTAPADTPGPATGADANLTPFNEQPWNQVTENGWDYARRTSSRHSDIVADGAAPESPPRVLRIVFTPDMEADTEPAVHWLGLPNAREVRAQWWMKLSRNWFPSTIGAVKVAFLWPPEGNDAIYLNIAEPQLPHHVNVATTWPAYGYRFWEPNVTTTPIAYDRWYRIDWHVRWESRPGAADGVIQWRVNDTLNGNYVNLHFPDCCFEQFEFAPTVHNPPPADQYMYVDHTAIRIGTSRETARR